MPTEQLLLRLPGDLVSRFKRCVRPRERSAFVRALLEQALPAADGDSDSLYLAALAVDKDAALDAEMADWETATAGDKPDIFPEVQAAGVGYAAGHFVAG